MKSTESAFPHDRTAIRNINRLSIRTLLSSQKLCLHGLKTDQKTGEFKAYENMVEGPASVMISTTDLSAFDHESANRCFILYLDGTVRVKGKGGTEKALFVSWLGGGQRMNSHSINAIFRRLRLKYGFGKQFRPHNMRHAFATDLLRRGAPVQDVSRMLGHKKLETTQVYTRLVLMDLKRCHEKCHPRGE